MIRESGATVFQHKDGHWNVLDEFTIDHVTDVFPEHWESFQQFLKAYGFELSEQSFGCFAIRKYDFWVGDLIRPFIPYGLHPVNEAIGEG